jgi:hypothetical protein
MFTYLLYLVKHQTIILMKMPGFTPLDMMEKGKNYDYKTIMGFAMMGGVQIKQIGPIGVPGTALIMKDRSQKKKYVFGFIAEANGELLYQLESIRRSWF